MKKSLVEIYALAVCFFTVMCFTIFLGIGVYDIIEIIHPEFALSSYDFGRHQTNDEFTKNLPNVKTLPLTEDEITQKRIESLDLVVRSEKREAFQSLTYASVIILINIVIFFIHWKLSKRERL